MHAVPRAVPDSQFSTPASQFSVPANFTAAHRLLRGDGFGHVIRAESVANEYFKIFFSRNDGENAKLGIIASKKVLPRAVCRNRIKRVIREVFRQHSIKICKMDIVVLVRRAHLQKRDMRGNNLETLFGRVESRCVEL